MTTKQTSASRPSGIPMLLGLLAATFAVAGVSSVFTITQITGWYATLAKPSFNPPNGVFGPIWSVLYTGMAVAAWRVWRLPSSAKRSSGLRWFWMQLALNFAWSFLFISAHAIRLAGIEVLMLWGSILVTLLAFWRLDRWAGAIFGAYLGWVSFASVLNLAIWRLN